MSSLNILWTSDNAQTAINMIAMYSTNALRKGWFTEATVIIWGGSNTLIKENKLVQKTVVEMLASGVVVKACKSCADKMETTELLESLGVEVHYVGELLSNILKDDAQHLLSV
jgi:hypothetical protein